MCTKGKLSVLLPASFRSVNKLEWGLLVRIRRVDVLFLVLNSNVDCEASESSNDE